MNENEKRDLLAEWLKLGREVLERYYPGAKYAVLVAELGDGLPAARLVVIPATSSGASPDRAS